MGSGPAYRIETQRLVIRCFDPADAPLLTAAVESSIEHLRPWLPWAHSEPVSAQDRVNTLRSFRARFDLGQDFFYGIFNRDESELLGGTGLHTRRGPQIREIGYWIRAGATRRGFATESAAALVRVAFEIERVRRVEIRCDPTNVASSAVPHKLGFAREGLLRQSEDFLGTGRDTELWSLVAEEYAAGAAKSVPLRACGAAGEILLA